VLRGLPVPNACLYLNAYSCRIINEEESKIDKSPIFCNLQIMQILSFTDVEQNFDAALETVRRGPILIQHDNRDVGVIISIEEYKRLCGDRKSYE